VIVSATLSLSLLLIVTTYYAKIEKHEIDVPDELGYRASHYAAITGNNMCLAILLDAGANPNALDASMKSPIYYGEFL
jgi:ankyrin repeat protein